MDNHIFGDYRSGTMDLSAKELSMIKDTEFLVTKIEIITKIEKLLKITKEKLIDVVKNENYNFVPEKIFNDGRIFKGEYYKKLPYVILDFPRTFGKENIFAYRTMFWWGNFFSSTLHLQGEFLEKYRERLLSSFDALLDQDIYFCVGETPWEYHYGKDNYVKLSTDHRELFKVSPFIKLSKRIPLTEMESVPQIASNFFLYLSTILNK